MRVFISYHSKDREKVQQLVARLKEIRPSWTPFFDEHSLTAGYWMPQLAEGVSKADAFLFLFGEKLGPWQTIEYYGAFDRRVKEPSLPITPILLSGAAAPGLPFFDQLQWRKEEDFSSPDAVARIVSGIERADFTSGKVLWRLIDPYRGLKTLREEDAALLFGREQLLAELVEAIAQPSRKVIVAVGNSGVGKSSLIFAGLFAALSRQGWPSSSPRIWPSLLMDSRSWLRLSFSPREDPLKQLAGAFVAQWLKPTDAAFPNSVDAWSERMMNGGGLDELLHAADAAAEDRGLRPPIRYVIYVDQGEELYARSAIASAERFSKIIADAACNDRCRIIMSLRADFYGRLIDDDVLFSASQKFDIPRLTESGVREMIEGPAKAFNAAIEPRLVSLLVKATMASPSGLPLLSYQMEEIWRAMVDRGDGELKLPTRDNFEIASALLDRADGFLAAQFDREDTTRRLFCTRLIHVPVLGAPTRQVALQKDLSSKELDIVQLLSGGDYRLITTGENDRGEATVEIGHETLLSSWERLRDWISDRRSFYAWLTQIGSLSRDYESKPERKALLQGRQLEIARAYSAQYPDDVRGSNEKFIVASAEAERRDRIRTAWKTRAIVCALTIGLTVSTTFGWYAIQGRRALLAAQSAVLAKDALEVVDADPELAALLALEAWGDEDSGWAAPFLRWIQPERPLTTATLQLALDLGAKPKMQSAGKILETEFSEEWGAVLTLHEDGAARMWDTDTGRLIHRLGEENTPIGQVKFSTDGRAVVALNNDNSITIFSRESGSVTSEIHYDGQPPLDAFAATGEAVAVVFDGEVSVWSTALQRELIRVKGSVLGFSEDGRYLVVSNGTPVSEIHLWKATVIDLKTGTSVSYEDIWDALMSVPKPVDQILANFAAYHYELVARYFSYEAGLWGFSIGGSDDDWPAVKASLSQLSKEEQDRLVPVWLNNLERLRSTYPPDLGYDQSPYSIQTDGKIVKLVDPETGNEEFQGWCNFEISDAMLVHQGRAVAAVCGSMMIIWDRKTSAKLFSIGEHPLNSVKLSLDGTRVATGSTETTFSGAVWDSKTGDRIFSINRSASFERQVPPSFSPDGSLVASVDGNDVLLLSTANGRPIKRLSGHTYEISFMTFSASGDKLVASSAEGMTLIWNVQTGRPLAKLPGPEGSTVTRLSTDENFAVATHSNGDVRIWDVESQKVVASMTKETAFSSSFSKDGNRILIRSSDDEGVVIWNWKSSTEPTKFKGAAIWAALSPDSNSVLITTSDSDAGIWDVDTGVLLKRLEGHGAQVVHGDFSPEGKIIATAGLDGTSRLWDVATGTELRRYVVGENATGTSEGGIGVRWAEFSADGLQLVTASQDGTWSVWPVFDGAMNLNDEWSLITYARSRLKRCLTDEERRRFDLPPLSPKWCGQFLQKASASEPTP